MRTYERSGVHVDQCTECRGIFLDRGELERLVDAENAWQQEAASSPPPPPRYQEPRYQEPRYQEPRYQEPRYQEPRYQEGHGYGHGHRKKRKSFFEELFD
jgi:uncharacterized protein